ncbi:MAG: VOC family protein [Chloroflexota bacterium]
MFDHMGIVVSNIEKSRLFYEACLSSLGYQLLQDNLSSANEGWLVFGSGPSDPFFVVATGTPSFWSPEHSAGKAPLHLAFVAPNDEAVDAFYQKGLENHGVDNGAPGPRKSSTPLYAAFLIDPDGNNVEACHR